MSLEEWHLFRARIVTPNIGKWWVNDRILLLLSMAELGKNRTAPDCIILPQNGAFRIGVLGFGIVQPSFVVPKIELVGTLLHTPKRSILRRQ
jgi:hypothetical protein